MTGRWNERAVGAPLGPGSLLWSVAGDPRGLIPGTGAGIMQLMLPGLGAGVSDHSNFFDDPYDRIYRSIPSIWRSIFAVDDAAGDREGRRIRDFHPDIKGVDHHGNRYHALDPDVFWWAHATFTWEFFRARQLYFPRPLSRPRQELLYAETVTWYRRYGVSDRPVPPDARPLLGPVRRGDPRRARAHPRRPVGAGPGQQPRCRHRAADAPGSPGAVAPARGPGRVRGAAPPRLRRPAGPGAAQVRLPLVQRRPGHVRGDLRGAAGLGPGDQAGLPRRRLPGGHPAPRPDRSRPRSSSPARAAPSASSEAPTRTTPRPDRSDAAPSRRRNGPAPARRVVPSVGWVAGRTGVGSTRWTP